MTLRTKETDKSEELSLLSEQLFAEVKAANANFNLTYQAPLSSLTHPALLRAKILHDLGKLSGPASSSSHGWWHSRYPHSQEALKHHPQLAIKKGFPFEVAQVLKSGADALLDFDTLGIAYLTRQPMSAAQEQEGLPAHLMSLWLNYALSPELWGSQGKWPRFHQRLHTLFEKHGLLIGSDYPGLYVLKPKARVLESFGFQGHFTGQDFQLVLPWDFPLSAVKELERVFAQEPKCSF